VQNVEKERHRYKIRNQQRRRRSEPTSRTIKDVRHNGQAEGRLPRVVLPHALSCALGERIVGREAVGAPVLDRMNEETSTKNQQDD